MKCSVAFARSGLPMSLLLLTLGCAKTPPPITEVEGVVLLNEQPLPNAQLQFMPELSNFGAEQASTATTDEQGKFRLMCNRNGEPGAVVAKHRVIVTEFTPKEVRGNQDREKAYQEKLKNRPIPEIYKTFSTTPLIVEVKPDQKTYTLKLTR